MVIKSTAERDQLYYCSAYKNDNKQTAGDEKAKVNNGSVFVGDMKGTAQDNIFQKKLDAQKKALRTILDQFKGEQVADDALDESIDNKKKLESEAGEILDQINAIDGQKKALAKEYGINPDSQEAKDLELLKKSVNNPDELSMDERKALSQMQPTEYQERALELEGYQHTFRECLTDVNKGIKCENLTAEGIKLAMVKTHGMVEAQKKAADIMKQAAQTVITDLVGDAKDKQDDKIQEEADKAQEKKEEKTEEKKAQEKAEKDEAVQQGEKAPTNDQEASLDETNNQMTQISQVQTELQNMVQNNQATIDDIKGLIMDEKI